MGCKVRIKVLKDKFVFEDEQRSCHDSFCVGTNVSINAYEFPRWNDPSRSPYAREDGDEMHNRALKQDAAKRRRAP